jgi:hypothetical protein
LWMLGTACHLCGSTVPCATLILSRGLKSLGNSSLFHKKRVSREISAKSG